MKKVFLMAMVAIAAVACGPSTSITKSWMETGASVTPSATDKVMVIAMVKDEASRRVIEDMLVKRIKVTAVSSYSVVSPELFKTGGESVLDQKLKEGKYTHVLLMRLSDVEKETTYTPGTTTMGFYGGYGRYYGYGASMYATPGYYSTDKNYYMESTVYSVNPDKLLWTGTTKTVNPAKIEDAVNDIADVVVVRMRKDGFLK